MTKRIIKRITKPITLALAMIGISAAAFAGAPGNNMVAPTGTPVIAPDSLGTWSFGLEALYMQSNTNFQYANVTSTPAVGSAVIDNESVTNEWNWGVEADISYMFPGSSRDVSASYTHLNQDGNDSVSAPGAVGGVYGTFLSADSAKGTTDQSLNAATLTFGQLLTVGDRVSLHPFGGLAYADIDTTNKANYFTNIAGVSTSTDFYKGTSDFQGIGPRAGMDAAVHLGSGFSIVGTMAGDLLVGSMDSDFYYNNFTSLTSHYKNDSYTQVVPELDAKLGLDYMYAFNPNTSMNVQLGYQVVNYFNAESQDAVDSVVVNSTNNTNDFDYNGPYLRLQLNVA